MTRKPNKVQVSMLDYLTIFFFPAKEKAGVDMTRRTRGYYRSVVLQFCECHGAALKCGDVTDESLARYSEWLIHIRGYNHKSAAERASSLRSIARHCFPERWPIDGGGRQTLSWHSTDIVGTLEQIFMDEYLPQRTRIGSTQTVRQYGRCLRLFGEYLERPAVLSDLTDKVVGKFLRWLVDQQGVRIVTANGYVKQIKALWVWAAKKRLVKEFPTIDKLPQPKGVPVAWTEKELRLLISWCRKLAGTIGDWPACAVWLAFHYVLWDSGERTGAMLQLRWEWLSFDDGYLVVPGEFRKGRQTPMVYPLKPATLKALKAISEPQRDLIFPMLQRKGNFYKLYKQLVLGAGLQYVPHKSGPQKMRRTYASNIEAAGGNATRALKHVDRRVTEESYLDPRIAETSHENERLFGLEE